ncbi:SMP-30/gluconolactonase/LRE family protein [Uliginosibacterium sp. sgz301328]|uniref:SMP-30/gluconolactonase/LRE family protein n=1 Tax=Uliginosibacterium sp. sgz301328 TaxID=3243764 RepID=UPI00359ED3AD
MSSQDITVPASAVILPQLRCKTGESPVWSVREQCFYWVDIPGRMLHRYAPSDGALQSWATPESFGCIALRAAPKALIAACETAIFKVDLGDDGHLTTTPFARYSLPVSPMRYNDGRCDRQGRFWTSTLHTAAQRQPAGELLRVDPDGQVHRSGIDGLYVANGIAFSPDGRTMYCSDTGANVRLIWAFDYDIDSGTPSKRRLFVDMNQHIGRPDGASVDADGCYWISAMDGGALLRFTPAGKLDRTVHLPINTPTMPCFGGADLGSLLVTTAFRDNPDDAEAGRTLLLTPGVRGLADAEFAG